MKKSGYLRALGLFIFLFSIAGSASAQSWVANAKKLFENDEYQKVISQMENIKKDNLATMFLAFSHLQEYVFNKTKFDQEKFKAYKIMLEAKLNANDIDNFLYFVNLSDKPMVVKEARHFTKKAFDSIRQIEDVPKLITFLNSSDKESRKLAMAAISKILASKRKYVKDGGTLRSKDVETMGSKQLITALLENIQESEAKTSLELIEEPVLQFLDQFESVETAKLETQINKDIASRKKKYPDSNWYSATGKTR